MSEYRSASIASRKLPKQARSNELVAAILDAAVQVLAREGAQRFTTARVAERAGVSVGSLYQYFPNKAAILFRLQSDEWRQTADLLRSILDDRTQPPLGRLRRLVHAFIRSECDEAAVRVALGDAAPLYRDAPEAREAHAAADRILAAFMREALPRSADATRASGRGADHQNAPHRGQGLFRQPAHRGGDRNLCRCHGRYVLRLSRGAEQWLSPTGD